MNGSPRRATILLAPVTITPTKPITPAHLKGMLWADVLYKATRRVADIDFRYSLTTYNLTAQTLGFWAYLETFAGPRNWDTSSEEDIGELYVDYQSQPHRATPAMLRPFAEAVESTGWVHPASTRLVELWRAHYQRLGLFDPGLADIQPPELTTDQVVDVLAAASLAIDHRPVGGPVYLDATAHGLPLRQIVTTDGQPNYLACALRELVPLARRYDHIVLLCDRELECDYLLVQRALETLGACVCREVVDRLAVGGSRQSTRHGRWRGYTLAPVLEACASDAPIDALRLGLRAYFIAVTGKGADHAFDFDLLRRTVARADNLLRADVPDDDLSDVEVSRYVRQQMGERPYVDPYRLTTGLLAKHRRAHLRALARDVYT